MCTTSLSLSISPLSGPLRASEHQPHVIQAQQQATRVAHINGAALSAACTGTSADHSRDSYQRDCVMRCVYWHVRPLAWLTQAGTRSVSYASARRHPQRALAAQHQRGRALCLHVPTRRHPWRSARLTTPARTRALSLYVSVRIYDFTEGCLLYSHTPSSPRSLFFTSAEGRSSYTCLHRHLRAPAFPRTHCALTHRARSLVPDLALALDIIIIVVMSAVGSESPRDEPGLEVG